MMIRKFFFIFFLLLSFGFFSCNKYHVSEKRLSGVEKQEYLEKIKKDPLFQSYIESISVNYNKMATIISQSNIDSSKFAVAGYAKNYQDWVEKAKAAGLKDPEQFLRMYEDLPVKLKMIYKKYPLFSTQFTFDEQHKFIQSELNPHLIRI